MRQFTVLLFSLAVLSSACSPSPDVSSEIRKNWVQAFYISSASGAPALLRGDRILVDKRAYHQSPPSRGDLVVFWVSALDLKIYPRDRYPNGDRKAFISRVVGVPGDRIRIEKGDVYINGEPEPVTPVGGHDILEGQPVQLYRVATPRLGYRIARRLKIDYHSFPEVTVEPDRYFVLGNNRDRSYDSRFWGTVHRNDIFGKAWLIYFSTKPGTLRIRPSRFFLRLHKNVV